MSKIFKTILLVVCLTVPCVAQDGKKERETRYYIPPYTISNIQQYSSEAEAKPSFLRNRGDFTRLKKLSGNGKGIKVGIVDTGLDYTHSRVGGELPEGVAVKEVKDFTNSRRRFSRFPSWIDNVGHGTHIAGHIGARANNKGIEGIASECDLYIAKALGDRGYGTDLQVSQAIVWLIGRDVDIINLSLSGAYSSRIEAAVKLAASKGILVFAALGNDGESSAAPISIHPGSSDYTFGIAAVDYKYNIANFSSRSKVAMYSGFGVRIFSTINDGKYAEFSGTSMATADQTGVAALILGYAKKIGKPIKGMMAYHEFIEAGIADLGIDGRDTKYGFGFIVIEKIIKEIPTEQDPIPYPAPPADDDTVIADPLNPDPEDRTPTPEVPAPTPEVPEPPPETPAPPEETFNGFKKVGEFILQGKKYILLEEIN